MTNNIQPKASHPAKSYSPSHPPCQKLPTLPEATHTAATHPATHPAKSYSPSNYHPAKSYPPSQKLFTQLPTLPPTLPEATHPARSYSPSYPPSQKLLTLSEGVRQGRLAMSSVAFTLLTNTPILRRRCKDSLSRVNDDIVCCGESRRGDMTIGTVAMMHDYAALLTL